MSRWRRAAVGAVLLFIAVDVVLSLVAWRDELPDLPHTHATTDRMMAIDKYTGDGGLKKRPGLGWVFIAAAALRRA